jgi:hypothetical protein
MELYKVNKSCFLAFKVLVGSCTGQLFLSVALQQPLQQQTHPFWEESISVEQKNSNNYFEPTKCQEMLVTALISITIRNDNNSQK